MDDFDMLAMAEAAFGESLEARYGEEVAAMLRRFHGPGLLLHAPPREGRAPVPRSWLWGAPTLPEDIAWPMFEWSGHAFPMSFLAQIDCASVPRVEGIPFPEAGTLMFFYDLNFQKERSSRTAPGYLEGGRVVYVEGGVEGVAPREMPPFAEVPAAELGFIEDLDAYDWDDGPKAPRREAEAFELNRMSFQLDDCGVRFEEDTPKAVWTRYFEARDEIWPFQGEGIGAAFGEDWPLHYLFGERESSAVKSREFRQPEKWNTHVNLLSLGDVKPYRFFNERVSFLIPVDALRARDFDAAFADGGM